MLFCRLLIVSKSPFSKNYFRNTTRVLNHSVQTVQIRTFISELGSNYLLNKSVHDENHCKQGKHVGKIVHAFLLSADFFHNHLFQKKSFRNTIRVADSLDPDQVSHSVGLDLGSACLQRLSAVTTGRLTLKAPRKKMHLKMLSAEVVCCK